MANRISFTEEKWPVDADHPPPASEGVMKVWSCTSTPSYTFMTSYELIKQITLLPLPYSKKL
jgi:hypothetical protein